MTTPTTGADSTDSSTASVVPGSVGAAVTTEVSIGAIETEAVDAVQVGLGTAHAAIWTYNLISAWDRDPATGQRQDTALISQCRRANEQVRDSANDLLSSIGVEPVRTEAAYQLPVNPVDRGTALQLAALVEKDCTSAWRAVIGETDNYQLRRFALTALSDAAVRQTGWKQLAGQAPFTVPFPGNETS